MGTQAWEAQAWETTPGPRGSTFQPWEHCSPHLLCDTAGTISQRSKGRCSRSRLWGSGPVAWPTLTGRPPYICGGELHQEQLAQAPAGVPAPTPGILE